VVDVEGQMLLYVVLRHGVELSDELQAELRRRIREDCSPRHSPDSIESIREVPRTLSNKKLEVPVKKILLGADPSSAASRDSLANPEALDWFAERARTSASGAG
jgi:acetoacetyl-CoA synthetase